MVDNRSITTLLIVKDQHGDKTKSAQSQLFCISFFAISSFHHSAILKGLPSENDIGGYFIEKRVLISKI